MGTPKTMLGALCVAAALLVAVLPASAHAEALRPHVVTPDAVTPHEVTPTPTPEALTGEVPATEESSAGGGTVVVPDAATPPSPASAVSDSPDGDLPSDGPGPKPQPTSKPCTRKPGYICPYFCPDWALTSTCGDPPELIPLYTEPREYFGEFLRTMHLCTGLMPTVYAIRAYTELFQGFGVSDEDVRAIFRANEVEDIAQEAWNLFGRLNCETMVEL